MNIDAAYRHCEAVTAAEARNFSYGIRLLPRDKRRAMCALYAMARRIDDIGDGAGEPGARLVALAGVRKDLAALAAGEVPAGDAVLAALADVVARFPVPLVGLEELVEGCEMDVHGAGYATFDDLVGYCRRVAGSIGRSSLAIYGAADLAAAEPLADALGVALQLTNILRDVVEDRDEMGRVYLPASDRERFGVGPDLGGPRDALVALVAFEAFRAEECYERGLALLPLLDRRSRACTAAMAGIYLRILRLIERDPARVFRGRTTLPTREKAAMALRAIARGHA